MYSTFQIARKYIHYYLTASNGKGHGTHSPFIFQFITRVLNDKKQYDEYARVEGLRKKLLNNKTVLTIQDLGAGSATAASNKRTIASLAYNAAKPKKFGQLLFRMVKMYKPKTIVELGTSLGITSAYLSLAGPETKLLTLEGADEVAGIAAKNFEALHLQNTTLVKGNFDATLPGVLGQLSSVDFVFIDGNHRQEPTERYFRDLLPKIKNESILVFDDIHWSPEMEQAWETIKADPAVRCTVDLFFIGIVFFKEELYEKQHFIIRF
ncbi:MAG: class I SAM-dependent methyltransferase [Bacteroidota bacterium]|nr:class I SAM-dependent methyltransferase [Bacteroidota bacterium]